MARPMTTRLTTLLCSCLLALAACGDDGGSNNNDVCGDGTRTGNEQCDDGNTTSGDGCSATCRNESSGPVCGDGVISGNEECDDNNTESGDGCSSQCETEGGPDCGNGMIDGTEDCDDGNSVNNDGCTGCNVDSGWTCNNAEPSVCTQNVAPNGSCQAPFEIALTLNGDGDLEGAATGDTSTGTSTVGAAACDEIDAGLGKELVYKFTLPDTRDVAIFLSAPNFTTDPIIRLLSTPCTLSTEIPELIGYDGCGVGDEDGEALMMFTARTAGTYYVLVDGVTATDAGAFNLDILALPSTCGDGELDGFFELCDDDNAMGGDGCNEFCDIEPGYTCDTDVDPSVCTLSCGNGFLDEGEECDDDNTMDGDGCSMTCTLEYDVLEAENNDTTPQAINAVNQIIKGSLDEDDVDLYTFTLTAPARVSIETYVTIDASHIYDGNGSNAAYDCDDGQYAYIDSLVEIFPMGANVMTDAPLFSDDDNGDALCSYVSTSPMLPAGTYIVKITDIDGYEVPTYLIDFKVAFAPVAGSLVINEYMANDGTLDTNCDTLGTTAANTDDEFVEIVNKGDVAIDLTGVTINDAGGVRHTFTANNEGTGSLILDPKKSIVVWGGGEPNCPGVTNWFVASSGSLALNNSGAESITLRTAGGVTISTVAFTSTTAGVSMNLDADINGTTYMLHNAVTGHVGDFSPGMRVNNTPF